MNDVLSRLVLICHNPDVDIETVGFSGVPFWSFFLSCISVPTLFKKITMVNFCLTVFYLHVVLLLMDVTVFVSRYYSSTERGWKSSLHDCLPISERTARNFKIKFHTYIQCFHRRLLVKYNLTGFNNGEVTVSSTTIVIFAHSIACTEINDYSNGLTFHHEILHICSTSFS